MESFLDKFSWPIIIILCLSIGLAPYKPPHVWEKLIMLSQGRLVRPIAWFDLFLHGTPWVILILKGFFTLKGK